MAETFTDRFGLRLWGAGTDTPSRQEFNDNFAALEAQALRFDAGLLADRPAAVDGTLYLELNGSSEPQALWWAVGTNWVLVLDATPPEMIDTYTFGLPGNLFTTVGKTRQYVEADGEIVSVRAAVGTAPTGSGVLVDVNKVGVSIFTAGTRPNIAVGTFTDLGEIQVPAISAGEYFTVDVDQIGSTVPGADLSVTVRVKRV